MNQVRFEALKARFARPAVTPSELLLKGQAAKELSDAGVFAAASQETRERVRGTLEQLLLACEANGGWQADRAASVTGRVLDQLDKLELTLVKPPWPCPWDDDQLSVKDRMATLSLELLYVMGQCQGWDIHWQKHNRRPIDDERIAFLHLEADKICASDDVLAAASAWCDEHGVPGALDTVVGDSEPYGDDQDFDTAA